MATAPSYIEGQAIPRENSLIENLMDFSFQRMVTPSMLKMLYSVHLLIGLIAAVWCVFSGFQMSTSNGLLALVLAFRRCCCGSYIAASSSSSWPAFSAPSRSSQIRKDRACANVIRAGCVLAVSGDSIGTGFSLWVFRNLMKNPTGGVEACSTSVSTSAKRPKRARISGLVLHHFPDSNFPPIRSNSLRQAGLRAAFNSLSRMEGFVLLSRKCDEKILISPVRGGTRARPIYLFFDGPARNFNFAVCESRREEILEPP